MLYYGRMQAQLVVGIFREHRDTSDFVFKAPQYQQAYHELIDMLNEKGVYVAVLMGQGTYTGGNSFAKHWVQVHHNGRYRFESRGPITVDVIFQKDTFDADEHAFVLNNPKLRSLCSDKHAAYELLQEFHPHSIIANNPEELRRAISELPGERVAVKPLQGNSGKGLFVGLKADALHQGEPLTFPVQVQEFIETSAGVPGITAKRHDIRVVLMNGEPILSTLRTPPEGGLKSNIGYGGESRLLAIDSLPPALLTLCERIDKKLAPYGRYRLYSADFGLTPDGWKLFEVNAMPGVVNRARGEQALYYQDRLTSFLKEMAQAGRRH